MLSDKITKDKIKKSRNNKLIIEYVEIEKLFPNEYNPNTHTPDSFDLLIKSIEYFGFTQPIVVHRETMKIVDGEHRYRAACVLNFKAVPVCFVDFDMKKLKYATIMHNKAKGTENTVLMNKLRDELEDFDKVLLNNR